MTKLENKILCFIYRFKIKTVHCVLLRFYYINKTDIYHALDNLYLADFIRYTENKTNKTKTIIHRTDHGSYAHSNLFVDSLDKWKERAIGFILGIITTIVIRFLSK